MRTGPVGTDESPADGKHCTCSGSPAGRTVAGTVGSLVGLDMANLET